MLLYAIKSAYADLKYKAPQQLSRLRTGVLARVLRKGNVIEMKQKKSRTAKRSAAKPSVRRVGTVLGSSALCVMAVGTISVCGLLGQRADRETKPANVNTTETARDEGAHTALDTVTWRKASINEYEFTEVSAAQTEKPAETTVSGTTSADEKKAEATVRAETEKKADAKAEYNIKSISKTFLYAAETVSLRKAPDKSAEVLEVLDADERVVVDGCTDDGVWYSVRHGEVTGFAAAANFTGKSPENKKAEEKAEEKKAEEKKSEEKKSDAKKEETSQNRGVISYTDEEFEMLCYVLQGEVGNCSEASKIAVANVIINRVRSSLFPNSISAVLTAPTQFDAIYGYYNGTTVPTQNTRDCAARALAGEDNTNGATYYYAPAYCGGSTAAWFETLQFCLEVDGQRYFKNW